MKGKEQRTHFLKHQAGIVFDSSLDWPGTSHWLSYKNDFGKQPATTTYQRSFRTSGCAV